MKLDRLCMFWLAMLGAWRAPGWESWLYCPHARYSRGLGPRTFCCPAVALPGRVLGGTHIPQEKKNKGGKGIEKKELLSTVACKDVPQA